MNEQDKLKLMAEFQDSYQTAYNAGVADFYKTLMQLPEETLDADAKQAITFSMKRYCNTFNRAFNAQKVKVPEAAAGGGDGNSAA